MTKRTMHISITVLLVVATVTVGYLVFQKWRGNTNVVAGDITVIPGTRTNTNVVPVHRVPLERGEPNRIHIPDRDIQAPVVYVEEANEERFQEALASGVVHYPGTAAVGELGNPYIFGHSSDYAWKPGSYKKVFAPLVDIPIGTAVRITNDAGELYIYTVIETKVVGPKDVSVLDQYNNERYMLTLQTSYPIGTALKRFIAVCELDSEATFGPATN
ncbi:MAG: sortase [Candidatus Kerfeldbacteria bacterium]|nr:sortase [Candidatus Kerfeldbacteria bacterium]